MQIIRGDSKALILSTGRLVAAWTETPTTWYPLPIGVGALLLAVLSWRKKAEQDAETDPANPPVSRGRWQVSHWWAPVVCYGDAHYSPLDRSMFLEPYPLEICLEYGDM